jgi:hypothetical protein
MHCYFCEERRPGGTHYGHSFAHGICKNCGVGVCIEHGVKESSPGSPLLCKGCAEFLKTGQGLTETLKRTPSFHQNLN